MAAHRVAWKNDKHAAQWPATLTRYAYPIIGELPLHLIDTTLVMKVIEPIWSEKPETANRLRGRIETVLDWATVRGYRHGENPARWRGHLDMLLPSRSKVRKTQHHSALPYAELPAFLVKLREQDGVAARALEFTILTAARTGETIGAKRSEIDTKNKLWISTGRAHEGRQGASRALVGSCARNYRGCRYRCRRQRWFRVSGPKSWRAAEQHGDAETAAADGTCGSRPCMAFGRRSAIGRQSGRIFRMKSLRWRSPMSSMTRPRRLIDAATSLRSAGGLWMLGRLTAENLHLRITWSP